MVVAIQPSDPSDFNTFFFLTIHHLHRDILETVPGVAEVASITSALQTSGSRAGKSYFHREQIGSVCENILEIFERELYCIRNPGRVRHRPLSHIDAELLETIEEESEDIPSVSDSLNQETSDFSCHRVHAFSEDRLVSDTKKKASSVFKSLRNDNLIRKDLLSTDHKTTAFLTRFKSDSHPEKKSTQEKIADLPDKLKNPGFRVAFAGQPRDEYESSRILGNDILKILPAGISKTKSTLYR